MGWFDNKEDAIKIREETENKLKAKDDKITEPPSYLSKEEIEHYNRIVSEVEELGIITNTDKDVLAMICICLATIEDCQKRIREEGRIIESYNSYGKKVLVEHPSVKLELKYMQMLKQYIQEMPIFSPSARAKLGMMATQVQEEKIDPILRIINNKE